MKRLCAAASPGRQTVRPLPRVRGIRPLLPSLPAEFRPQVRSHMTGHRVGLWLVGAFGGVGTAITVGLAAMARGLADRTGLVTELPLFAGLPLPDPGDFVIGGHDIRATSFADSAEEFRRASGVFEADWLSACKDELAAATARVRPGSHFGAGKAISKLADWGTPKPTAIGPAGRRPHRRRPGRLRRRPNRSTT